MPTLLGDAIDDGGLVSLSEARRLLGAASRTALYGWMRDGELPYVVLGRRRAIPRAALRAFVAARLVGAGPAPARGA
ncbi:MAG: helix-turn-helix domain-containing protein [Deltaproteobacteria bacterium]|nr:helix-turn-helix domain-containing protein [Deltaproteobacteria bacterium]